MSSMTPNEDFLKDNTAVNKPVDIPSDKPIPKMEEKPQNKGKKAKASKEKKDATWKDVKVKSNPKISNNKVDKGKTQPQKVISQEQYDIEKAKYPEYFALSDYHKKCLIATNYWRVMNGIPIIEVPALYTYYHKYFDKRCYELAKEHQEKFKRMENNKISSFTLTIPKDSLNEEDKVEVVVTGEVKSVEPNEISDTNALNTYIKLGHPNIEPKLEVIGIPENVIMPEVIVTKEEITEEKITEIYNEAVEKFPSTMEKLTDDSKADDKKDDSDNQLSLF